MNFFTKNRILIGAVILLAALNLAILGTISFNYIKFKDGPIDTPSREKHARLVAKELNLSPEQEEIFNQLRNEYAEQNQEFRRSLREQYRLVMRELGSPEPNRQYLDSLSQEIGRLHFEQQQTTIDHFLKVRESCSFEQYQQLQQIFKKMMTRDQMQRKEMMQRRHRMERMERKRFKDTLQ